MKDETNAPEGAAARKNLEMYICPKGHESLTRMWVIRIVFNEGRYREEKTGPFCAGCYAEFWEDKLPKVEKKEV